MSLINRSRVRRYALDLAQQRAWKPTRISADVYAALDKIVATRLETWIAEAPSKGVTLYPPEVRP